MDSVTQAVLGAAVAEAGMGGKRLGRGAIIWGVLLGTLPDLDVLVFPWMDKISQLEWHRGPSHSLLVILLVSPLFGLLIHWWHRRQVSFVRASWTVFWIFLTHVLIDLFTVYGTLIWWPFNDQRVGTNNFFIIDPLFTLPLLIGVGIAFFASSPKVRSVANHAGLLLAVFYTCWSFAAKAVADEKMQAALRDQELEVSDFLSSPTPFNTVLWRGLAKTPEGLYVGYYSLLDGDQAVDFVPLAPVPEVPADWEGSRAMDRLAWFSDGFFSLEPKGRGFVFRDWRFGEIRDFTQPIGGSNQPEAIFSWYLEELPDGEFDLARRQPELARSSVLAILWRRIFDPGAFEILPTDDAEQAGEANN